MPPSPDPLADELHRWVAAALPDLESLEPMASGAGTRRYWRARTSSGACAVCMQSLPENRAILPPALRDTDRFAFLEMTHWLAERSFPVPELIACEPRRRWLLLEDLGTRHLLDLPRGSRADAYREALELLARLHALPAHGPADALPYARRFDREWIAFELGLFLERVPADARNACERALGALAQYVAALPVRICLRDYQSQNLMIDARGRLRILDYQDALLAPPELDLAALLHDSYVEFDPAERAELLRHYERARGEPVQPESLAALIVQRKCKDWSRFRLLIERGDTRYAGADTRATRSILAGLRELPESLAALPVALEPVVRERIP